MPLAAGTRLGTYEIVAPLGAGAMGEVDRAKDLRLGREIALKVLPETIARDAAGSSARLGRRDRRLALGLLGLTVLKFLFFDLRYVDVFWRFVTAIAVGAGLLAVSYLYRRRSRASGG